MVIFHSYVAVYQRVNITNAQISSAGKSGPEAWWSHEAARRAPDGVGWTKKNLWKTDGKRPQKTEFLDFWKMFLSDKNWVISETKRPNETQNMFLLRIYILLLLGCEQPRQP